MSIGVGILYRKINELFIIYQMIIYDEKQICCIDQKAVITILASNTMGDEPTEENNRSTIQNDLNHAIEISTLRDGTDFQRSPIIAKQRELPE